MKIREFIEFYESLVPLSIQEEWDNSGFQIGNREDELSGILLSLDFGLEVVEYAIKNNFNLIFTHHPVFFNLIKNLEYQTKHSKAVIKAIKNDIAVYSSHTNLDFIEGGVNDTLAKLFEINDVKSIIDYSNEYNDIGLGRYGFVKPRKATDFIEYVKDVISEDNILVYGDLDKEIFKVGVTGGSGADTIENSINLNLDILITSDIKYHQAEYAVENNLIIIDLGHYISEKFVLNTLYDIFNKSGMTSVNLEKFFLDKSKRKIL